jgi:DNA-binding MarR family transcriptional regulator
MADHERFARVATVLSRGLGRLGREAARAGDVTPQQAETLLVIAERGAMSTSAIALVLGIDPSTASRNLAGLERTGFVVRKKDADDARQSDIRLTPRGRRTVDAITESSEKLLGVVLERLPKSDRVRLFDVLEQVAKATTGG